MFVEALFTMAKEWRQPKYPSIDEWITKWCIYNGMLLSHKRKRILPPATTGIALEGIMLSGISWAEKGKYHMVPLINRI